MSTDTKAGDLLKQASQEALQALGSRVTRSLGDGVSSLTDRFDSIADGGPIRQAAVKGAEAKAKGDSPVMGGIKGALSGVKDKITGGGGKSGGSSKATKSTNIEETIDVGVPIDVAYNQWTEFGSFPSMMKKVENVEAPEDTRLTWKAQIFWSHRTWEATILEQVPDSHIVWRSKGEKGHVDGAVTFHELAPNLTRILVALEYYPQGLFEKTGNIWEAQGRRARAELRHFRRHVMTRTILDPDAVQGWRGTIEDGEVVETHEEALEREEQEREEQEQDEGADEQQDEYDEGDSDEEYDEGESDEESDEEPAEDEYEDSESDEEPADEYDEDDEDAEDAEDAEEEPVDEYDEEEPEDEYDEDAEEPEGDEEPAEDEYEDEEPEEDVEEERPRRRRRSA
jgi:uncharacterized membrane protein